MTAAPALTIVIPAYNEAENLTPVVHELLDTLKKHPRVESFELLLVNDGSSDATGEIADALAQQQPAVRVVHHPVNRGFGAALRTGFTASRGRYVTLTSADGEVNPEDVVGLFERIGDADLIVGMRSRTVTLVRRGLTFGLNLLARLILGFVPDQVTVYVVRGELLRRMELTSNTGLANLEVILYIRMWSGRIRTSPSNARPRLSGQSKVTNLPTVLKTFWEMAKLRRAMRRRRAAHAKNAA